jgi:hypothetical protein
MLYDLIIRYLRLEIQTNWQYRFRYCFIIFIHFNTNVCVLYSLFRSETHLYPLAHPGRRLPGSNPPPPPPTQEKFKKHRFCRYDLIKGCTWFTLQSKSATEIGWWLVHWNAEKCKYNLQIRRLFSYSVNFNFPCNLTWCRLGDFDMICVT